MSSTTTHTASHEPIRVFLVDDHPVVRRGLSALLEQEPDLQVAGEADGILGTAEQLDETRPDILLIDLNLGRENGLDLLRFIHDQWVGVRTIVLSQHPPRAYAEQAIAAGASGYVCKDEAAEQIVDAIRKVQQGGYYFDSDGTSV